MNQQNNDKGEAPVADSTRNSELNGALGAEVAKYLAGLSGPELIDAIKQAYQDLDDAAKNANETPWHEACFAATIIYLREAGKRGMNTVGILGSL